MEIAMVCSSSDKIEKVFGTFLVMETMWPKLSVVLLLCSVHILALNTIGTVDGRTDVLEMFNIGVDSCTLRCFTVLNEGKDSLTSSLSDRLLRSLDVSFTYISFKKQEQKHLQAAIHQGYWEMQCPNFLVFSDQVVEVMEAGQSVNAERPRGTLFVNRAKFMFITSAVNISEIETRLESNLFDNIAVITVDLLSETVLSSNTLMWRRGRTRTFDSVTLDLNERLETCKLFPNTAFFLNGRNLYCLSKQWTFQVQSYFNAEGEAVGFKGMMIEFMQTIADSLNATVTFYPHPSVSDRLSWSDVSNALGSYEADMSIPFWVFSTQNHFNHSVAYPTLFSDIVGLYKQKDAHGISTNSLLASTQYSYLALCGVLILTVGVTSVSVLTPRFFEKSPPNPKKAPRREVESWKEGMLSLDTRGRQENSSIKSSRRASLIPKHNVKLCGHGPKSYSMSNDQYETGKLFSSVTNLLFGFAGTLCQQPSLPDLSFWSARIMLWVWSMGMLLILLYYKGNLTAEKIKVRSSLDVRTFEQLSKLPDYKWCLPKSYMSYARVMAAASKNSTVGRLYAKMSYFDSDIPSECDSISEVMTLAKTQPRFVAIVGSAELHMAKEELQDLVYLEDSLWQSSVGLPLTKDQQFRELFALRFQHFTEVGFVKSLNARWNNSYSESKPTIPQTAPSDNVGLTLEELLWLFAWCAIGVLLACLALCTECLYKRLLGNIASYLARKQRTSSVI